MSQAEEEIVSLTEKYEGYINDYSLNVQKSKKVVFMAVKVPQKNFEKFFSGVKEIGKVDHSQITTRDVTTEYIDLKARLETLEAQEKGIATELIHPHLKRNPGACRGLSEDHPQALPL
jgi:hypothetical protein